LLEADAQEVQVIRDALAPHKAGLLDRLWAVVEKPEKGKESQRLRAAAALAAYDPNSERWANTQILVDDLLAVPPDHLTGWKDAFRPIRVKLLAPLSVVYRSTNRPAERSLAADILADYAADQPRVLADLLLDADDKQFAVIFPKLKEHAEQGAPLLTSEISRELAPPPVPSDWTVRFYKWHDVDKDHPANWDAVLKSPILDELRMPRLYLVGNHAQTPAPPTPRVPPDMFAVVATSQVTLGEGEYTIRATVDDGVRVWLDNDLVIDDWVWGPPRTKSAAIVNKLGRHLLKVEFFQASQGYTLDVDLTSAQERQAKRQVNAAVALLRMDRPEKVWPLLEQSPDPRVRSYLIHALSPLGADARALAKQLNSESDATLRRALLLSLGEFNEKDFTPEERKALLPTLHEMYRTAPDAGLHAASEWLLRQWKEEAWIKETNQAWAKDTQQQLKRLETIEQELTKETGKDEARWYVNGQGQTLVVVPGPVEFWMGSPPTEEGREGFPGAAMELRHWRRIGRSFAIAAKEVTVDQFLRFRKDHPVSRQQAPSDDCPVNNVAWYDAVAYCNWLSEQEGIPRDQWCYESNRVGQYAQGMKLAANYLQRTGYRLPTEAEWEFACRAGAVTKYSFGESEELLPKYAWYQKNWEGKLRPVGSLKPNDLGLFDIHGNDWEWCQDEYKSYPKGEDGRATEDNEDLAGIDNAKWRILRGGVFYPMGPERSAARGGNHPWNRVHWNGLRPVRTLPFRSFDRYAAARAAALAAAGESKDKPLLDAAAKATLRRQAIDWLKAELSGWSRAQPPRLFIARNLLHWQLDSALAGIRDQAALAKLTPEEQEAFTQLWANVAKTAEPANSAERLELARLAVLLAAGQGKDEPPFDDAARARLRQQALDWLKAELTVTAERAVKAQIIAAAAPLPGLVEKLAESAPRDGPFQAELARHYAERGNNPLANAAGTKARALFEAQLAKEPESSGLAEELADLLLIDTTRWTVLKPIAVKSQGGATLTVQPDHSVLASGESPVQDTYTVEFEVERPVTALRLEALPDPSLPGNGPGRSPNGNFHLKDIRVRPVAGLTPAAAWTWLWVYADFGQDNADAGSVQNAVDNNPTSAWGIWPEVGRSHWAVLVPDLQGGEAGRAGLTVRLEMGEEKWAQTTLGRFRLSVSHDPVAALERERKRLAARKFTDPWAKLAAAYGLKGRNDKAVDYYRKALQADPKLGDDRQAQYRYQAARAAARAAAGQGQDEPLLDDAAKAKLRRQALDWLKAELTVWTKELDETESARRAEHVWIEDDLPPGAKPVIETPARRDAPWTWVTRPNHPVFSGSRASVRTANRLGQHYFEGAPVGLRVGAGDTLFAHVYLDPARPPREIMLQWFTGAWMHRAYWGDNLVPFGRDASTERVCMGPLPEAGKWARLEVEAARVGIKPGMVISGWAFTQFAGTVYWDKAGIVTQTPQGDQRFATAPPEIIVPALNLWRTDPDLAGTRDAAALSKLPAGEQKQWQALWADVASALRFRLPRTGPHSEMRQDRAGKWLAVPNGQAVALFDARTGELAHTLTGHSDRVHTVAFSPDGRYLAGGNLNWAGGIRPYVIKIWDVQTGNAAATLQGAPGWLSTIAFDGDGKRLFCGGEKGVDVWDLATGKIVRSFGAEDGANGLYSFALSPDGKKLAWGNASTKVKVCEIGSDKPPVTLDGHEAGIQYAAYSPDGKLLATGSDKELLLWDAEKLELVRKLDTPAGWLAFEPDGKTLLTATHGPRGPIPVVTRWDLATSRSQPLLLPNRGIGGMGWTVYHLASDGKTLFSLINDGAAMERRVRVSSLEALAKTYPAILQGDEKLADNAERLQIARIAYDRKQFAAATRLWAEALAADAQLGNDRQGQQRYNAACVAALAGAGQGKDEPPLDDTAKAKLRRQALDWLKAEQTIWRELFESGPPKDRPAILQTLSHWQEDTDLAGIRDAAALAKLPADEQKRWQALWAQVPELSAVVPTSKEKGRRWHYTREQPAEGWQKADFDDKEWKQGVGAFGTREVLGALVRTEWNTADIWLRRELTMPEGTWDDLLLLVAHDDDAEVYINGVLALKVPGVTGGYEEMPLSAEARKALKPGKNVFAVHCHNVTGPQHIDVGIVAVKGNAARLALARIAFDRRRFALATQLWADALANDPKAGDDRQAQHRYYAARAAALAAAGQANDELRPNDAARAKLRGQALDWLKAELTAWTKHIDAGPDQDQPSSTQALILWRKESDLAGIRDGALLAMLPAEEQRAFTRLWADVAVLLAKKAEKRLTQHSNDLATVEALATVLVEKVEPEWTVLKPLSAKSEGGATLTVQPDASVLAGGINPDRDVYVIEAEAQGPIGAIRLEAIPDPSMPEGGSGRSANFILTDIRVAVGDSVVKWANATADFSQLSPNNPKVNFPVHFSIDADESTGWAIGPRHKEPHWAVFVAVWPLGGGDKTRLTIRLAFQNKDYAKFNLGRFRLSAASPKSIVTQCDWFLAATSPHARLGAAYLAVDDARQAANFLTKATTANPKSPAADYLVLALAHARLKETAQLRNVCGKVTELLAPTGADAGLRPLLREVLIALGPSSPEATALLTAAAGQPPAALSEAIQRNPDKADGYRNRASWFADRGLWKESIEDLAEAFRLESNTLTGMRIGILLLQTGEIDRYRAHCRVMLERWASTENNGEADQTLKMIVLLPDFKADAKPLARLAEVAVSGDKKVDWFEWWMLAKGLHDYRTGKYVDALATCRESRRRALNGKGDAQALTSLNLAIEAMALHHSGDEAGAKRALAEAKSNVEVLVPGIDSGGWSYDWLTAHMLYREAEGLIARKKAEQPK
jgi:formylglycine-generating enzyme required for sulfatase activity/tetratricopeptide (TPR) repeat protein